MNARPAPPSVVIGRPQCYSDPDCRDTEQCHSGNCVRACLVFAGCGTNAECSASAHRATCGCLRGYDGDPYVACYPREYHKGFCQVGYRAAQNCGRKGCYECSDDLPRLGWTSEHLWQPSMP